MDSEGEAVAENVLYYQKFVFFCVSLCSDLWRWVSAVHLCKLYCSSYYQIELLWNKVFDKKKNRKNNKNLRFATHQFPTLAMPLAHAGDPTTFGSAQKNR